MPHLTDACPPPALRESLTDQHIKALDTLFFKKDVYPAPSFNQPTERYHYFRNQQFEADHSGLILEYITYGDEKERGDFKELYFNPRLNNLAERLKESTLPKPQNLKLILVLHHHQHYISAVVDLFDWTHENDQHRFSGAAMHFFDSQGNKGKPGDPLESKTTAIQHWEPVLKGIFQSYIPSEKPITSERIAVSNQAHFSNNCGIAAYINAHAYALNLPLPKTGTEYGTWREALTHDIKKNNQKKRQASETKKPNTQETSANVLQALTRLSLPISAPTQAANQPPAPQSSEKTLNFNPFSSANKTRGNYKEKIRNTFECFCQEFSDDIHALDLLDYLLIFPFLTKLIINKIDNSQLTQRSKDILNSLVFIGYLITFFIPKLILSTLFTGLIALLILPLVPNTKKAISANHATTSPSTIPTGTEPLPTQAAQAQAYSQPVPVTKFLGIV